MKTDPLAASLERVLRLAGDMAGAWGARARASTTLARQRAILRLLGVSGLDRAETSLASMVVERALGNDPNRLAGGIALPFAVALLEYDVTPQQLALDVASGAIDLALEAQLLNDPARRAAAEAEVGRLMARAVERIDANRTARHETIDVLGDAPRPWVGVTLAAPSLDAAPAEAASLVAAGADLLRVRVPAVRELVLRLHDRGIEPPDWRPHPPGGHQVDEDPADVPAGSQRALAALRARVDEAAAKAGRYVRLSSATSALAAPEQALVAALERIDVVEADPIAEIVADGVDPARALADSAFAHLLLRRAGAHVLVGPGPLVVAPDLARGMPPDAALRAGRAFAMQALAIAFALGDGIPAPQIIAGALPPWLAEERNPATQALAAVALQRAAWPELSLAFDEPAPSGRTVARWPVLLAIGLAIAGPSAVVVRRAGAGDLGQVVESTRTTAALVAELGAIPAEALARPAVAAHATAVLAAAADTLERLRDTGWDSVLGMPPGLAGQTRLGADAVAERTDAFDPVGSVFGVG
jgi:hypothetical protein